MPAQRSRASLPHAHGVGEPSRSRFSHLAPLLGAVVTVFLIVVLGVVLLGGPVEQTKLSEEEAPPQGEASATLELDVNGNLGAGAIELSTAGSALHLSVPVRTGLLAGFDPEVRDIRAVAGDSVVEVGELAPGDERTVELPQGTSRVRVEFSAAGTFKATSDEAPGRGLTLLTPLAVTESTDWSVEVDDPRVLDVACTTGEQLTSCASAPDGTWVAVPTGGADVVAEVDLD